MLNIIFITLCNVLNILNALIILINYYRDIFIIYYNIEYYICYIQCVTLNIFNAISESDLFVHNTFAKKHFHALINKTTFSFLAFRLLYPFPYIIGKYNIQKSEECLNTNVGVRTLDKKFKFLSLQVSFCCCAFAVNACITFSLLY